MPRPQSVIVNEHLFTQAAACLIALMAQMASSGEITLEMESGERIRFMNEKLKEIDALSLFTESSMRQETVAFLLGELGEPPASINPALIEIAKAKQAKIIRVEPVSYDEAIQWLAEEKILPQAALKKDFKPTNDQKWQILQVATLWDNTDRKRGLKHVMDVLDGSQKPQPVPDFPEHLKGMAINAIGGPAEIEQIALHVSNIARAQYFISRIDRLQLGESDERIADRSFYKEFHEGKIRRSLDGIEQTLHKVLGRLREAFPDNKNFAWAVSAINRSIEVHCQSKGLPNAPGDIPKITPSIIARYGVRSGQAYFCERQEEMCVAGMG